MRCAPGWDDNIQDTLITTGCNVYEQFYINIQIQFTGQVLLTIVELLLGKLEQFLIESQMKFPSADVLYRYAIKFALKIRAAFSSNQKQNRCQS